MRILVADDDPVSRHMMQGMLQRSGYEVIVAVDGVAACEELAKPDAPRLALIDWMMPGLDGPSVCRRIRRKVNEAYIYIMLLTSKQSGEDIVEGLQAGADDYLTKPCRPAELKARLMTGVRILQLEDKLVEAREAMRARATKDALTQLWNRASILGYLKEAMDRREVHGTSLSVLLCDVDHFKRFNDTHGHLVGDQVLQQVAARLASSVRAVDFVGRYGGEEFLIVLNGCRAEDLPNQAERVRRSVTDEAFETDAGSLPVSISIGATTLRADGTDLSVEQVVKEADVALYQAKADGRNRVCLADALVSAG
jgi:two-component system cell cycle response regulator